MIWARLARFVTARIFTTLVVAAGFIAPRTTLLRLRYLTGRIDAAEGAAQFVQLALVGEFLALGEFDEFQNFIQLVNGLLERLGDLGGNQHGFVDGRTGRGAQIRRLGPFARALLGALRFRTTFLSFRALLPFLPLGTFRTVGALIALRKFTGPGRRGTRFSGGGGS